MTPQVAQGHISVVDTVGIKPDPSLHNLMVLGNGCQGAGFIQTV